MKQQELLEGFAVSSVKMPLVTCVRLGQRFVPVSLAACEGSRITFLPLKLWTRCIRGPGKGEKPGLPLKPLAPPVSQGQVPAPAKGEHEEAVGVRNNSSSSTRQTIKLKRTDI